MLHRSSIWPPSTTYVSVCAGTRSKGGHRSETPYTHCQQNAVCTFVTEVINSTVGLGDCMDCKIFCRACRPQHWCDHCALCDIEVDAHDHCTMPGIRALAPCS